MTLLEIVVVCVSAAIGFGAVLWLLSPRPPRDRDRPPS